MSVHPKSCHCCHGTGRESDPSATGGRLKRLRLESGVLLKDLAAELGISPSHLCMLEAGKRNWTLEQVEKFIRACHS